MTEWFVYCNLTYYPWAEIIDADTPEEAARLATGSHLEDGVVVFPADAIVYTAQREGPYSDLLKDLRDQGANSKETEELHRESLRAIRERTAHAAPTNGQDAPE